LLYRREAAKPNEIWQADYTLLTVGKHSHKISDGYSSRLIRDSRVLGTDQRFLVRQALQVTALPPVNPPCQSPR
jgi:hypothetical protein